MNNLKTDNYSSFNEDDFVEENGSLRELTVTITLCEYRNIIRELAWNDKTIDELNEKVERLREELEDARRVKVPDAERKTEREENT